MAINKNYINMDEYHVTTKLQATTLYTYTHLIDLLNIRMHYYSTRYNHAQKYILFYIYRSTYLIILLGHFPN